MATVRALTLASRASIRRRRSPWPLEANRLAAPSMAGLSARPYMMDW